MCNHYRNDIRKFGREMEEYGFEEFSETRIKILFPDLEEEVFPDRPGLVARLDESGRLAPELMRWGFPPVDTKVVTNIRHPQKPFWRGWLDARWRCLVPATAFAEWSPSPPRGERWFAAADDRGFCFAGLWRPWTGVRGPKSRPLEGTHKLFAFLTTDANALVAPIHAKAMPVVLRRADWDQWLTGSPEEALALQRPAPEDALALAQ